MRAKWDRNIVVNAATGDKLSMDQESHARTRGIVSWILKLEVEAGETAN